jgi:hypothetical protein
MKNLFFIILNSSFLIFNCLGQSQFQIAIGGTDKDFAYSMIQTADGGYALAGYTMSFGAGSYDMYILKLNASGSLQWTRTIGGTGDDKAFSVIQTTDGEFVVAGKTFSFGAGSNDMFIVKLDGSGTIQWTTTVGGAGDDIAYSIVQTADGGFTAAGYTLSFGAGTYDIYIAKLDANGTLQWNKTVGGIGGDQAKFIIRTTDGGFAAAGHTASYGAGGIDMYLVKLDASGTTQWSSSVGGTANDYGLCAIQTADGGYILTGYTAGSFGAGASDMFIAKFNSSGTLQWSRTVGGTGSEIAWSIMQNTDGSYVAAGGTGSFGTGALDAYIVKLSTSGSLQWSRTVGTTNHDVAHSIIRTTDGGYALGCESYTLFQGEYASADMYMVKLTANWNTCGNSRTQKSKSGTGGTSTNQIPDVSSPTPVVTSPAPLVSSGGALTTICSQGNGALGPQETDVIEETVPRQFKLEQNYPNPFNPKSKIKYQIANTQKENQKVELIVFNVLGEKVSTLVNEVQNSGTYEVEWDATNYPSGVYFYKLTTQQFKQTKRMVLIK